MRRRGLAPLVGAALLSASAIARAEVAITPAADGQLGAWLVAGPLKSERARELAESGATPSAGAQAPGFRPLFTRQGALDLDRALGTGQKAGAAALLGGSLVLEEHLHGYLLASIDGAARLFVDGKPVWEKSARSLRGGGWDAIPLDLSKGSHALLFLLEHPGAWWALELRLLDARDLLSPRGARLVLPKTTDADQERLAAGLLGVRLDPGTGPRGFRPRLSLELERGSALAPPQALRVEVRAGSESHELSLGELPLGPRGVPRFEASLPALGPTSTGPLAVEVRLGSLTRKLTVPLDAEAPALLLRASAARDKLGPSLDPASLTATLDAAVVAVEHGAAGARARLQALLADLEAGRDPLAQPGLVAFARRSVVDAEPDPALLHVPAGFAPGGQKRYPLVVLLHGLNGTPERIMEAFLDTKSRAPSVGGFVLAPHAHGNAFYRGPGEREVMAAVDWALATYPIDPLRVSVSGVSMGGTGAAHLGLYYAERFSAAAPLCGYHSYFVRRDTKNRPIRPWETERMHHWSPASLAERGRNLPLRVAHGTKDFPLENSRVLVDRYKQLGYSITDEWPDTGHDVWTKAYAGARLYPWLSKAVLDPAAARVTVKSDSLRFGRLHWAAIRELEVPGKAGTLDVDASSTPVRVKTDAVSGFELARGPRLPKTGPVELEIDGQSLGFAAEEAVSAQKRDGRWTKGAPSARGKRPGLEGPIRDAYLEPLVFSYGTGDPRTTRANREVALGLSRRFGPEVGYRVLSDAELDAATLAGHSVLAVGSPRDHLLLGRVAKDLLIQSERGALVAGARRFERAGTGAIFIQPNPAAKERYLVVVTAVDAAGIWRALSLPQLLPDFLIYDEGLGPAAAEVVLGRDARVLAGGFFDLDWKLPRQIGDPVGAPR